MQLPQEITSLFPENLKIKQISEEAVTIINKIYQGVQLEESELDILLNPTEAAALLTAKYRRTINHRYIKEITRMVTNPKTGHVTPARLTHDKLAGATHLYRVRKILAVKMRRDVSREAREDGQKGAA
jgi:hypothetical protein